MPNTLPQPRQRKRLRSNTRSLSPPKTGAPGSAATDVKTLHRIDPDFEIVEIEKAGFRLAATSDVLHNADDPHTEPAAKMSHMEDRFVLKFVKP